ncbi:MAG: toprim domain-containing protein [Flavobacteriales bacterium]|nr:toprim domain-containing protein [Flavobacteriales bacterium]
MKSRSLYGIHFAKKSIADSGICCLVEGYTDVISLHQAGVHNVVASSGTSLTEDQVRLIKRYAQQVTILYDGDPAGIKASLRGIDLILAEGLGVKVVLFPDGEDPTASRTRPSAEVEAYLRDSAKGLPGFQDRTTGGGYRRRPGEEGRRHPRHRGEHRQASPIRCCANSTSSNAAVCWR